MKKIKILLMIMLGIIIILGVVLLCINVNKGNSVTNSIQNSNDIIANEVTQTEEIIEEKEQGPIGPAVEYPIITESDYLTLQRCITSFLNTSNRNSSAYYGREGQRTTTDEEISSMILKLLSSKYIENNKITIKNIKQYVYNINKDPFFIPTKIIKYYETEQVNSFVIKGLIEDIEYNPIMEANFILNMDTTNNTYSIEILKDNQDINTIKPEKMENIEINEMNVFEYSKISDEEIIKGIITLYKRTALGYPEYFYQNHLNNGYQQKFKNASEFKTYIQKNKGLIEQINIQKYKKIENNDESTYVIVDQYSNTYIVEYTSIVNYKMYLDSYTVELDTFKENYDNGNDATKVAIQVGKFKQMLNTKDYNAIYNKLNDTFKTKNFSNVSKLESYLKKNTFEINSIKIDDSGMQDDYYVCSCTLINQQNTEQTKKMTIMMKLIDSNNFSMSFSIDG